MYQQVLLQGINLVSRVLVSEVFILYGPLKERGHPLVLTTVVGFLVSMHEFTYLAAK